MIAATAIVHRASGGSGLDDVDDVAGGAFGLGEGLFGGAGVAEDELGCAVVDVALNHGGDVVGGADGGVFEGVHVGTQAAHDVGGRRVDGLGLGVVEAEADDGAEVVVGDGAPGLFGVVVDALDAVADLVGGEGGGEPAVAPASDAAEGGLGAPAYPHGHGVLVRLGLDGGVVDGVVAALEGDVVLAPEAAHEVEGLVGAAGALLDVGAAGLELVGGVGAETDGGEHTALADEVDGGDFLGEDGGITEGQGEDAVAELHTLGAGGDSGHDGHRLHAVGGGDDAVGQPDGVGGGVLDHVDVVPEDLGVLPGEGPAEEADAQANLHDARLSGGRGRVRPRWDDTRRAAGAPSDCPKGEGAPRMTRTPCRREAAPLALGPLHQFLRAGDEGRRRSASGVEALLRAAARPDRRASEGALDVQRRRVVHPTAAGCRAWRRGRGAPAAGGVGAGGADSKRLRRCRAGADERR